MLPMVPDQRICTISCTDASNGLAGSNRDPGGIQAFLNEMTKTFAELTTASTEKVPDPKMTPAEAQSYWAASLSVTHRQSTYLSECLHHLEDFLSLAQYPQQRRQPQSHLHADPDETSEISDSSPPLSDYHVDRHDDLVGLNIVPDTDADGGAVDIVTAAEHLRFAADCLAKITGKGEAGDVEDILGVVFEK
jgi:hypothetical protein